MDIFFRIDILAAWKCMEGPNSQRARYWHEDYSLAFNDKYLFQNIHTLVRARHIFAT